MSLPDLIGQSVIDSRVKRGNDTGRSMRMTQGGQENNAGCPKMGRLLYQAITVLPDSY